MAEAAAADATISRSLLDAEQQGANPRLSGIFKDAVYPLLESDTLLLEGVVCLCLVA